MKAITALFLFLMSASVAGAQVQVDSNYTILARGVTGVGDVIPFLLPNLKNLLIQENRSGKICAPEYLEFTFIINSESLPAPTIDVANYLAAKVKARDKIIIEKVIMPKDCFFEPPKQIVLVIQ